MNTVFQSTNIQTSVIDTSVNDDNTGTYSQINPSISNNAKFISNTLVVTKDGAVLDATTGNQVTDSSIVGTYNKQADPLAKTQGTSFIPQEVGDARNSLATHLANRSNYPSKLFTSERYASYMNDNRRGASDAVRTSKVRSTRVSSNSNVPYWSSYDSTPAFFEANGELFAEQAKKIIDVSSWQGNINWSAVKAAGIDGAIIRLGYGAGNPIDSYAAKNISECKRLGIPFGIYWYSYAESPEIGVDEGKDTVAKLKQAGVSPSDLSLPVYYDVEDWTGTWAGHTAPSNPDVWDQAISNWFSQLDEAGYTNLSTYSYISYLRTALNNQDILNKTRWIASYGPCAGTPNFDMYGNLSSCSDFQFASNERNWQYSSSGTVNGIQGRVDLDVLGNKTYVPLIQLLWIPREEDIAVGAAVTSQSPHLEYKWQAYNLSTSKWETIADWNPANWAGWSDSEGDYWLHLEVRNGDDHSAVGESTICFRYQPGITRVTGTYAGWQGSSVLLGESSNNLNAKYQIKIYDVNKAKWVIGFNGQWAYWHPQQGIYWTHYEVYTSTGNLADTKTYAFQVD